VVKIGGTVNATQQRIGRRLHWGWLFVAGTVMVALGALASMPAAPAGAQSATATPTPFVFEDNDPALRYVGNDWNLVQDPRASGGTLQQARTNGSQVRMQFFGSYVKLWTVRGPNRGFVRIIIDGEERQTLDLYKAGDPVYELITPWWGGLDGERSHQVIIEVLGQRNGASSDTLVAIDKIEVERAERAPNTPTPTITPSPTATASPTATSTPQLQPTSTLAAERSPGSWPIDSRFLRYYVEHDGLRILGNTLSPTTFFAGRFTQYFEKGRLEDHTGESTDPNWQFQYGLLVDELQIARAAMPIGGDVSTLNYAQVNTLAAEGARAQSPAGFTGGTMVNSDGSVFVPYSQALTPAPGHNISPIFWPYINRQDIFPGGWLHDVGLPMTEAVPAVVTKGAAANRQIFVQVFQRTILTYDPLNPADFQVERANVGTDYRRTFPDRVPQ
jgi:hypothetical protein